MTAIRAALAAASLSLVSGASPPGLGTSSSGPCRLAGVAEELRCGTYEVWEHRAARSGRRMPLAQDVTPNVVDDLDEVREALGVAHVNLWGSSGATRQALVWTPWR